MTELKAAVGMSRKWDAREAGKEIAKDTLDKLGTKPDFFLLLSTIHYRDNGGFEEFLKGVCEILPKGTPLVGGTVVGFVNQMGCFMRGATALAVSNPAMDVAVGYGKNTKRNPKKAAEECAEMIKKGFEDSNYKKKFLFNLVSASLAMKIPGQGYRKFIDSEFLSKSIIKTFNFSQKILQKGFGREDEVFEEIVKILPEYCMVLGTSVGGFNGVNNFQFFNDKVLTNTIVSLGISTDSDFDVYTTHGMKRTDIGFEITKVSKDGHIIQEINGKPAVPELYRLLNWPDGFLNEKNLYNKILYYPLSLKRHGREVPVVMPFILKDYIGVPCKVEEGDAWIMTISGKKMINSLEDNLKVFRNIKPEFGLYSTCITIAQALGNDITTIRQKVKNYFRDKPFILFFCAGEGSYSPEKGITYANMSYNSAIFGHKK